MTKANHVLGKADPAHLRAKHLTAQLTLGEKIDMVSIHLSGVPRLGIKQRPFAVEIARGLVQRDTKRESTILPQPWGLAATFDEALMHQLGDMAGDEVRISSQMPDPSGLMLLGPTVDMERDPRWGRNEEAYGEDPVLAGKLSAAYVCGLRGDDDYYIKTAPILKHFYANNYENERQTTNANITPRLKHDYYLKPFEIATREGGAVGLMTAYNMINGVEAIRNPDVRDICKAQWDMLLAVSDGGDFGQNVAAHRTYANHAESIADILGVGADLMLDSPEMVAPAIEEALKSGLMAQWQLDSAVEAVLTVRFMLGDFDEDHPYAHMDLSRLACSEHKQLAVKAAEESMVLLENNGLLPIKDDGKCKVAVVGPLANENYVCWYCGYAQRQTSVVEGMCEKLGADRVLFDEGFDHIVIKSQRTGGYICVDEQGNMTANAPDATSATVFERNNWGYGSWTLRSKASGKYVTETGGDEDKLAFALPMRCTADEVFGWFVFQELKVDGDADGTVYLKSWQNRAIVADEHGAIQSIAAREHDDAERFSIQLVSDGCARAAALAKSADYAVVCTGNHPLISAREEYDRPDIILPPAQSALLESVCGRNEHTLLYLITGYPFAIMRERKLAKAVLMSTHLGPCLGHVAAATIFGDNVPAGRTPTTWYRSVRELPKLDDYDIMKNNMTYQYYRGKPLYPFGYGLSYSAFVYANMRLEPDGQSLRVCVDVTNVGEYDADEVVQLYVVPPKSPFKRPLQTLKAFKRVHIKRNEAVTVEMAINVHDLAFWQTEQKAFVLDEGAYTIQIGTSSKDIRQQMNMHIDGQRIAPRNPEASVEAIDAEDYSDLQFLTDATDGQSYIEGKGIMSYAVYAGFDLSDVNAMEVLVSSPSGQIELAVVDHRTDELIGRCAGMGTGGLTRFVAMDCDIAPRAGVTDIRLCFSKQMSIKSFRFYRKTH